MTDLAHLLHATFGFPAFRANQEAVCVAATAGRDVLLVMPTGAGKSLCYQLPAIARGGTALVISPLIALMDDQAAKLSAAGLKVGRIHSGLSRDDARQACRDYLNGTLNFLFIAPERMRVPGFPEMLAKRKPSLIAIDEAHCISAWGHDFRPDYRSLGEHLPALRPAPILALTATATPTVQRDIAAQLNLQDPALFIHGFRRSNLAIEAVEMSRPRRHEFTAELLKSPAARPAIVYASSRKACEELTADLGRVLGGNKAAAYHAGLEPAVRERVQAAFQAGTIEVVVATIAFGMGIDKADVRTVVHTSLPASVEAYYQEIGRAGRDGLPSRTVLLYSFVDRRIHEGFLERDYPPSTDLARVAAALTSDFLMPEPLWRKLKMAPDLFGKSVEKLASQGAAQLDMAGNVRATGLTQWRTGYDAQVEFRRTQIDRMMQFAESRQCRMTSLIRHFGDLADATRTCGQCDACNPSAATARTLRAPDADDLRHLTAILHALEGQARSTGKLHTELAAGALRGTAYARERRTFDTLLDALCRAALIELLPDTFTNPEGKAITYKKAALTHEGRQAAASGTVAAFEILLESADFPVAGGSSKRGKSASGRPSKAALKAERQQTTAAYTPAQRDLELRLRDWRKAEAARTGRPAFFVFGDTPLRALVLSAPTTISELLTVAGIGPDKADRYGADIVALCRNQQPASPSPIAENSTPKVRETSFRLPVKLQPDKPKARQAQDFSGKTTLDTPLSKPGERTPVRAHTIPELAADLTPAQQVLDSRLREWRRSEAERLGLPQFFVLGASALRSIVLIGPTTPSQLETIAGVGIEKAAKFGTAICAVLNA